MSEQCHESATSCAPRHENKRELCCVAIVLVQVAMWIAALRASERCAKIALACTRARSARDCSVRSAARLAFVICAAANAFARDAWRKGYGGALRTSLCC